MKTTLTATWMAVAVLVLFWAAPAHADVLPDLDMIAVGGISHDLSSGYDKPVLFVAEAVLGPHYGPLYVGGVGLSQQPGVGTVIPFITYVAQGKLHGLFRGVAFQVGQRRPAGISGAPGYYFLVGVSR